MMGGREANGFFVFMGNYNKELIDKTIDVWQPHSEKKLTEEDAREIIENLTGFFDTLARWDRESTNSNTTSKDDQESDRNT